MQSELTRPIAGVENRTPQEVFGIMCDRIKAEIGDEEAPRYTTRRLHDEIRKAEERGRQYEREAALSTDAEPVKTPFKVESNHITEARVSLLSRAIRQGLNDYGWKNFGTLPEVLMGYIVEAERAEAAVHAEPVKTEPAVAETELKSIDELLMAGQGDDDGSQIMPEFEVGMSVAAKVEACLALLEYRRDVIDGYAADGDWRDAAAQNERWNAGLEFAMLQLCKVLKVDPKSINWDCATETLEGDAQSQIHKVLAASPAYKHGDAE